MSFKYHNLLSSKARFFGALASACFLLCPCLIFGQSAITPKVKIGGTGINPGLVASAANQDAALVLTKVPRELFLAGDVTSEKQIQWQPQTVAELRYDTVPGNRDLANHYPNTMQATGAGTLTLNPFNEGIAAGLYYCILVSRTDSTATSVEFRIIVEASSTPIVASPVGNISLQQGAPLFRWDPVDGVPYYLVMLSEGPISLEKNDAGKVTGLAGVNLIWVAITPSTFLRYGEPDPSGSFSNNNVPPLLPGIEYNWVVLNSYGPNPDFITTGVAPVAPSFFQVNRTTLAQTPTLVTPADGATVTDGQLHFQWSEVPGATAYRFFLFESAEFQDSEIEYIFLSQATTSTEFWLDPGDLLVRTGYKWRVVAENNSALSASATRRFDYAGPAGWVAFNATSPEGRMSRVAIEIKNASDGKILLPVVTDTLGFARLGLPDGAYSFRASRPGFRTTPEAVFSVSDNRTTRISFEITRGTTTVSGQVVDAAGQSLSGAIVQLRSQESTEEATTDETGTYSVSLRPDLWTITARKTGFVQSAALQISLSEGDAAILDRIQLRPATNIISGQIVLADNGSPLQGIRVNLRQDEQVYTTSTTVQGGYRIAAGPGDWQLTVEPDVYSAAPPQYEFSLTEDQQIAAPFNLFSGSLIYGTVKFDRLGVQEAEVRAYRKNTGVLEQVATTDVHGKYSLGLLQGQYELEVRHASFLNIRVDQTVTPRQSLRKDFTLTEAGFVSGKVVNVETAGPAVGARVVALHDSSMNAQADGDGNYIIGLPPGSPFQIDAILAGFKSGGAKTVTTISGQTMRGNDFFLSALSGIVQGRVTDGLAPISDVLVTIPELGITTTTDAAGEFSLEIAPGNYTLNFSKACHFSATTTFELIAGAAQQLNTILQPLQSQITGVITDPAGRPIPSAQIQAIGDTTFSAVSDSGGRYELCLNSGIFRVEASRPGFKSSDTTLVVNEGDLHDNINFILQESFASLTGAVRDTSDTPVAAAGITLENNDQTIETVSDGGGTFTLRGIIAGVSTLTLTREGLYAPTRSLLLGESQDASVDVVMYPADGFISGNVHSSVDSTPIADATVSAQLSGNSDVFFSTTTNSLGDYSLTRLPVLPGEAYTVFAFKQEFFTPAPVRGVLPAVAGVDFELVSRTGSATGTVRDIDTDEPINAARVEASNGRGSRSIAFSDSAGTFTLLNLVPSQRYTLKVERIGYFPATLAGVSPGDSTIAIAVLRKYGFIKGTVSNSDSGQRLGGVTVSALPLGGEGRTARTTSDSNGDYLLRLVADFYKTDAALTYHKTEAVFPQVEVTETDTVTGADFRLEPQRVAVILISRADQNDRPKISNAETHCYLASALDASNRPIDIGAPEWSLDVSGGAAGIDSAGCLSLQPGFFGDLTIMVSDGRNTALGLLPVEVFASVDSVTETVLFDDRGLRLQLSKNSVLSRADLLVSQIPLAPAKKGRAELFTTDSSFVIKPAELLFENNVRLMLPPPVNTEGQRRFIARWDQVNSEWFLLGSSDASGLVAANIEATGEYVALALAKPLGIDNLVVTPNPFSPFVEVDGLPGLRIEFDLSSSAAPNPLLTLKIYNMEGNLVRLLHDHTPFPRGRSVINWDGRTDSGALARNGRYLVRAVLEDPADRTDEMKSVVLIK